MADFGTASTPATGVGGTARTINAPSGITSGDFLVAVFSQLHDTNGGAGVINTLSGWSSRFSRQHDFGRYQIFTRVADGSEGATFAFVHDGNGTPQNWVGGCIRCTSVGSVVVGTDQLNGAATGDPGQVTAHVCPSMDLAGAASLLLSIVIDGSGWDQHTGWTPPGTVTERLDQRSVGAPYAAMGGIMVATSAPGAGASGTRTFTSQAGIHSYGFSLELTDGGGGPVPVAKRDREQRGPYWMFRRQTLSTGFPSGAIVVEAAGYGFGSSRADALGVGVDVRSGHGAGSSQGLAAGAELQPRAAHSVGSSSATSTPAPIASVAGYAQAYAQALADARAIAQVGGHAFGVAYGLGSTAEAAIVSAVGYAFASSFASAAQALIDARAGHAQGIAYGQAGWVAIAAPAGYAFAYSSSQAGSAPIAAMPGHAWGVAYTVTGISIEGLTARITFEPRAPRTFRPSAPRSSRVH